MPHVLIVGAGLLGLSSAYFLRQQGCEVSVVERQPGAGLETSFANGGMLHASQANPWNEPGVFWQALKMLGREDAPLLVRPRALPGLMRWGAAFVRHSSPARYVRNFERNAHLARYSLAQMAALRADLGANYDFLKRGTIKLFRTSAEVAAAANLCARLDEWGIAHEVIDAQRASTLEPALAPIAAELHGGLYFPDDEAGDAHKFCALLAAALESRDVRFHYGATVSRIEMRGGRAVGVRVGDALERADAVLIAGGSYSAALARSAGLYVPVAPVKGYSITLPLNGWQQGPQVPVIDDHLHAAVCPLGDRLRVAGTAEFTGFDLALTPSRIANLFDLVGKLYPRFVPFLARDKAVAWTGLRPMSCDGVGIMGRTRVPGLFLNTGHGPLGWTMAAGAGRLVADEIAGASLALAMDGYRLERF